MLDLGMDDAHSLVVRQQRVHPEGDSRRLVTGVNWSPGIINPFRELGTWGQSLDTILTQQKADRDEPVILVLHMACPRVEYTDRGKSSVVVES